MTPAGFRFASPVERVAGGDRPVETPERPVMAHLGRRERVLTYLRGGALLPGGYRTDGQWIWPERVVADLDRHGVPPEPELSGRVAELGYHCPPVTQAQVVAATEALRRAGLERTG